MKKNGLPKILQNAYTPICKILKKCNGKERAITNKQLQAIVASKHGQWLYDSEIRMIIHEIRMNMDVPNLLANKNGYYVSKDKLEIKAYKNALIKRAHMIFIIANTYGK